MWDVVFDGDGHGDVEQSCGCFFWSFTHVMSTSLLNTYTRVGLFFCVRGEGEEWMWVV